MKHLLFYIAAIGLLLVGAWVWWAFRPLRFHESWSEEQRMELTQMYNLLRDLNEDTREEQDMLRQVASTGRGDIYTPQGFSAAHLAAHMSFLSLLKDIVLRGADPNMIQRTAPERPESVFQTAMACIFPTPDIEGSSERAPQKLRLETLAWLLEHGADINTNASQTLLIALLSDMVDEWREAPDSQPGATLEWLLEHGLQLKGEELHQLPLLMRLQDSLPTLQRLWAAGYLPDTQETRDQLLIKSLDIPRSDTPAKARWALAMGAQAASALPACSANIELYGDKIDDSEDYNICLQALELLLSHGVKPDEPLLHAPHTEPQRTLYLDLLKKYQLLPDHG